MAPRGHADLITTAKKADINVFTVASGLLYERMAFLMMVSVLRHTKSSVKFWFIQNFLSPSFKAFIPHMAKGTTSAHDNRWESLLNSLTFDSRVRIRLRTRHVQMAALVTRSKGETADNLGVRPQTSFDLDRRTPKTDDSGKRDSYKILFLDVLFPLELDRVIFVDSDQCATRLLGVKTRRAFSGAGLM